MKYENVFYGFSMELPEPWEVKVEGRSIRVTDRLASLVLYFMRNDEEFELLRERIIDSLGDGNRVEKFEGKSTEFFAHNMLGVDFVTVLRRSGNVGILMTAPAERLEEYLDAFGSVVESLSPVEDRMPFERRTLHYRGMLALTILVPEGSQVREIPFEIGGVPEMLYEVRWDEGYAGRAEVAYSNTQGFLVGSISGPIPPLSSLSCREFIEKISPYLNGSLQEFSSFTYDENVMRLMLMSLGMPAQGFNGEGFEAVVDGLYLWGDYYGLFNSVGFFSVVSAGASFHYGTDRAIVQSIASSVKPLPQFETYRMNAYIVHMQAMNMEMNRIFQKELASMRRHNAEISAIVHSTFDEINRGIMENFYADLNQSYHETIEISDVLSGYRHVYDSDGTVYRVENDGDEYFINELGDTILAIDREALLEIEDDLKFWGWRRLKKDDEGLW
ncbi:hypothetical protein A3L09_07210 [Thermococcus profundus]|uniref:Uncharacterized protein n=1 Tax=Thermococcus profundus TaxID=49899 RepID=A0A2Z2M9N8_THEPR|nr:hypothetical protein A3L09_07210 [Thermococcus profundus]